jgi:hypothetical protein
MKRNLAAGLTGIFLAIALTALAGLYSGAAAQSGAPGAPTVITPQPPAQDQNDKSYLPPERYTGQQQRYSAPPPPSAGAQPYAEPRAEQQTYSDDEISAAGHRFFGRVSVGLARVIEYAFQKAGRPNGYILGEEAGGAFVAGLRYGEGTLYTKNAGEHKVFWQGPSIGYDFGAEGSKTMILVYNLRQVDDIYATYGGVDGSAYFIGGVGITFQTHRHVTLAPIRSGIGLRLGANVGSLKYTRRPTWNPF